MNWFTFWYHLRHAFLFSWRIWLTFLAMVIVALVLVHGVGWNSTFVMFLNGAIGGWLGTLAGRADAEQHDEEFEARYAEFRERWEVAMHRTVEVLNERYRD